MEQNLRAETVYSLLKEVFLILDEGDQYLFGLYDLSVTRYYALYHLNHNPGISLSDLSRLMLCDKSNVTRMVKTLERADLVIRKPHQTDRRSSCLFVTERGAQLEQEVRHAHQFFNRMRFETSIETIDASNLVPTLVELKRILSSEFSKVKSEIAIPA